MKNRHSLYTVVAYVGAQGHLLCTACIEDLAEPIAAFRLRHGLFDRPVFVDSSPHAFEACDSCHKTCNISVEIPS